MFNSLSLPISISLLNELSKNVYLQDTVAALQYFQAILSSTDEVYTILGKYGMARTLCLQNKSVILLFSI